MKKLISLIFALTLLTACTSTDTPEVSDPLPLAPGVIESFEDCMNAENTTTRETEDRGRVCQYGQMVFWEEEQMVENFEDCVEVGNPVMESDPRQCRHGDTTYVESVDLPDQPAVTEDKTPCTRDYRPVCGEVEIQCITTPCDPLKTTFANECEAENAGATNITEGACVDEEPNPEGACLSFDGNWIEETQECEGMGRDQCESLGGTFNECASACRNDPDAEMCTLQCVLVCQF